ncbi:PHP domain-containing protein [Bacteroides sp. 519]|uniref:PHP domain-containing protein n=1 Tax=Bacteroides sp. 519 TaxID=2302937 RepID=UPI0013D1B544|nr:PHP domain-containing protein [Bacteroides sp. 519]NDV58302.1 PHP domain-containing protein [Bacteroides sp. 519]
MIIADLHIHSEHSSDGEELVACITHTCLHKGIKHFSITDHNSVKGTAQAIYFAGNKDIHFIPGIEIDCNYQGTDLHVLGYNINWQSDDFAVLEKEIHDKVMDSFSEMISNIQRLGFVINADAVRNKAGNKLPTGELIAEVMLSDEQYYSPLLLPYMQGGERSDMPYINFYLDYFAQGKPAFVPVEYMSYQDTIALIKDNGGTAIVAHPGLNLKNKEVIAEELLSKGAEGLEVFNNYHTLEQISYFGSLVQQKSAIMTCGSDFHGKTKPLIQLGQFNKDNKFEEYLDNSIRRLFTFSEI